jgi:thioredoxin-like negative regulator of GroEL
MELKITIEKAKNDLKHGFVEKCIKSLNQALDSHCTESPEDIHQVLDYALLASADLDAARKLWGKVRISSEKGLAAYILRANSFGFHHVAEERLNSCHNDISNCDKTKLRTEIFGSKMATAKALTVLARDNYVSSDQKTLLKLRIWLKDERYRDILKELSKGVCGDLEDLLHLEIKCLTGSGYYSKAAQKLHHIQHNYNDFSWIGEALALNAEAERDMDLATRYWRQEVLSHPENTEKRFKYIDALINSSKIHEAQRELESTGGIFDIALDAALRSKIMGLNGNFDEAMTIVAEGISQAKTNGNMSSAAKLMLIKSKQERQRYDLNGDKKWLERSIKTINNILDIFPENYNAKYILLQSLLAANRKEEAKTLASILPLNSSPIGLTVKTWQANLRGNAHEVKKIWKFQKRIHFIPASQSEDGRNLTRVDKNKIHMNLDAVVYTCVRNEMLRLPWFLDYYRKLGIQKFVIIDNGSSDGSFEYLLRQEDVYLFFTKQNYFASFVGMTWVNYLKRKFSKNGWAIYVDPDEALVYDDCENRSIIELISMLEKSNCDAMWGYMIDMFSQDDASFEARALRCIDFTSEYTKFSGNIRINEKINSPFTEVRGGVRYLFGGSEELTKTPLINASKGVDFLQSSHRISPCRVFNGNLALLHYKFTDNIEMEAARVKNDKSRGVECNIRYEKYAFARDNFRGNNLENLQSFSGSSGLVDAGFISRLKF